MFETFPFISHKRHHSLLQQTVMLDFRPEAYGMKGVVCRLQLWEVLYIDKPFHFEKCF